MHVHAKNGIDAILHPYMSILGYSAPNARMLATRKLNQLLLTKFPTQTLLHRGTLTSLALEVPTLSLIRLRKRRQFHTRISKRCLLIISSLSYAFLLDVQPSTALASLLENKMKV